MGKVLANSPFIYSDDGKKRIGAVNPDGSSVYFDNSFVNVTQLGAVGDGVTDNTAVFNLALSTYDSVFVPTGVFLCNNINAWASNKTLYGEGFGSVLKQLSTAPTNTNLIDIQFALSQGTSSTATNLQNITIKNLTIRGFADSPVFEEHTHLIAFAAVSGLMIDNCVIQGFKGDGVYSGSALNGTERHNERLTIRNCIFEGVNKDNRNGISVIDCDGVLIENNKFINITRSNMPGAVDFEPNNLFNIIRNCKVINNTFENIGGNAGCVGTFIKNVAYNVIPYGFTYQGNTFKTCNIAMLFTYQGTIQDNGATQQFDVKLINNRVDSATACFSILGVRGLEIQGNSFSNCTGAGELGSGASYRLLDVLVRDNIFWRCGLTSGRGLLIFQVWRGRFISNTFDDCGTGSVGSSKGMDFQLTTTSKDIIIQDNIFMAVTGRTLVAINVDAGHTLTTASNKFIYNTLNGLPSGFTAAVNV